jgi:hypothetical protein
MDLAGTPILTYTVASAARMDDEALSWFVDNQVVQAHAERCGVSVRWRAWAVCQREVRVELDPGACWRWAPPRPTCRAS